MTKALMIAVEKVSRKFPDNAAPIGEIRNFKVKFFPNGYYKVTAFGDRNWSIRLQTAYDVANLINNNNVQFAPETRVIDGYKVFQTIDGDFNTDCIEKIEALPPYADREECNNGKIVPDFGKTNTTNTEEKKTMTNNTTMINGAITFEKEIAFAVNGTYKAVGKDGKLREVLPQFIIAKDIPVLMPAIAKKIEKGTFYTQKGKLYKALDDNKVIDLDTGVITEIAVATIPMTDAVIVYKPIIGGGKFNFKDMIKAQALAGAGNNPMMLLALGGGDDIDVKDIMLMNALGNGGFNAGDGNGGMNNLLPLMLLEKDGDGDNDLMETMLLTQAMGGGAAGGMNNLLPLLLLKDKKKADKPNNQ